MRLLLTEGQEMAKTNNNTEQLDEEGLLALADERYDAEDYENAFIYYKQAADRFGGNTLLYVANCYAVGMGVEQDFDMAFKYRKRAYDEKVEGSAVHLGYSYRNGEGVEEDADRAFQLFEEGVEEGDTEAMKRLGQMYLAGEGCEEDDEQALALYEQAAEKGDEEAARMLEILHPFLIDESQLIDKLTDKLIMVAQKPDMRKEFTVTYDAGGGRFPTQCFYKNDPPMSIIEQFFMAHYYVAEFETIAESEDLVCELLSIAMHRTAIWVNQLFGQWQKELLMRYHRSLAEIFSKIGYEDLAEEERAGIEECKQFEQKPYRPKKYSFDYWYAEAEKHDWEAMIVVSIFYHYGGFVRKNDRLSELWKQQARSTYNYYNPDGQPFDEVYAEIEGKMVTRNTKDSSTN